MKRKLRILVALVMSLTMMFGMSTTAFAADEPPVSAVDVCHCDAADTDTSLVYIISTTLNEDGMFPVYLYDYSTGRPQSLHYLYPDDFSESAVEGKVYHFNRTTEKFELCTSQGNGPTPPAGLPLQINPCTDTGTTEMFIFLDDIRDGVHLTLGVYDTSGTRRGWMIEYISDIESVVGQIQYGKVYHHANDTVTLCPCNSTTPPDDPTPSVSPTPAHIHSFQWQTIITPTKDTDGLEGEVCSCGAIRNTQPLSAFGFILDDYAPSLIKAAKPGQTVTFEFGEWNSFPKEFMAKLVDKSAQNVTFVFHYNWNHVKQEITIPAGTPIDLNFDWYGPAKMAELYGNN